MIVEKNYLSDPDDVELIPGAVEAMKLLAETEGVFTETAGGVTVAVTKKLIDQGRIPRDEVIVVCITGNGLKTQEPLMGRLGETVRIQPNLASFEAELGSRVADAPARRV